NLQRLCFAAVGVKYEDIRHHKEEWPQMKKDGFSPLGYLPVLEVKGKKLCESMAIVKYIARENVVGLTPSDSFDIAICDMIVNMDYDCFQLMAEASCLETDEERKLTYADILIFNTCESGPGGHIAKVLDNYPELKAHHQRVGEVPGIKAWVEKRPKTAI
ncbi:hypothetical protein QZH41_000849, partial [Actinostola sp. cb2023]